MWGASLPQITKKGITIMDIISNRLNRIAPSPTVAISSMALDMKAAPRHHRPCHRRADFATPPHIVEAATRAMHDGHTRYTQSMASLS